MAITDAHERFQDRRVTEEFGRVTYYTSYVVRCDARSDGVLTARGSSTLPVLGLTTKSYTSGTKTYTLTCSKCEGRPADEDDLVFIFDAEFTLQSPAQSDIEPNPLLRKPDIDWGFVTESVVLYEDEDGNPIQSSAGQQYDPPIEEERPVSCLVYQDNVSNFDPNLAEDMTRSINTANQQLPADNNGGRVTAGARCAYCHSVTASPGYENGIFFMRRRIEIHLKGPRQDGDSPWNLRVLDQGTYEIDDTDPNNPVRRLIRVNGQLTNAPVTLDGDGHAIQNEVIDPVTEEVILTGAEAFFFSHRTKKLRNFAALALKFP